MSDDNKPIGWWLKEVDRLLEASFEAVLADDGLTRRQWQVLNVAAAEEPIELALAPFSSSRPDELRAAIDPLIARGWLEDQHLTAAGRSALDRLGAKVRAQRERVTAGITAEEYAATIGVLRKMAENLKGSAV